MAKCKRCGKTGLEWYKNEKGKWVLYDSENGTWHFDDCEPIVKWREQRVCSHGILISSGCPMCDEIRIMKNGGYR